MCIPIRCWATGTRCCWAGKPSSQLTGAARSPDTHLSHTCSLSHGETTTEKEREESRGEWLAGGQDLCTTLTGALSPCVCHTLSFSFSVIFEICHCTLKSQIYAKPLLGMASCSVTAYEETCLCNEDLLFQYTHKYTHINTQTAVVVDCIEDNTKKCLQISKLILACWIHG